MKKIKHYALGLLGAALVTAGIIACSNEEANTTNSEIATTSWNKSGSSLTGPVGKIVNGLAVPSYDEANVRAELIADGTFKTIYSIELAYEYNAVQKNYESFMTVIGQETASSPTVAIVADLIIDGNQLIIQNPENNQQAFRFHECLAQNCRSCDFKRAGGRFSRITGCKPCSVPEDSGTPACNHRTNNGSSGAVQLLISLVLKLI